MDGRGTRRCSSRSRSWSRSPNLWQKPALLLQRAGRDRRVRIHSLSEGLPSGAEDVSQMWCCSRVVLPVVAYRVFTPDVASSPTAQRACATRFRPRTCGRVRKRVNVPQKLDERNPHVTSCKDTRRGGLLMRWNALKRPTRISRLSTTHSNMCTVALMARCAACPLSA